MNSAAHLIVVAEDNEPDVFLIEESIKQLALGCRVHMLKDGDEVMRFVDQLDTNETARLPDVILLDLNLPKRSGKELLMYLRKRPRCAGLPVIVMSSSDSENDRALAAEWGARAYFRKPVDLEQFLKIGELIRSVLLSGVLQVGQAEQS
jgi:CheY-like chemotaxis protein